MAQSSIKGKPNSSTSDIPFSHCPLPNVNLSLTSKSQPLLDLINLESSLTNFSAVENLFARALKGPSGGITASPDVNIWKAYLHYIRRQNPIGTGAADEDAKRRVITDAYEFALKQCGVDRDAGEIWGEYIAFVQEAKVSFELRSIASKV